MEPEITVYDNRNNQIGKTFARRAKQLVGKGRAVWTDDSQRAVVLADGADVSEIYAPNGGSVKDLREDGIWEEASSSSGDDLLRNLASERVRRKRVLWWHVAGIIAVAFFVFIFFVGATNGFRWNISPIIYFMFGICYGMIAVWGVWIFRQIAAVMNGRPPRRNEVEREFQRLKSMQVK